MSKQLLKRLESELGDRVVESSMVFDDPWILVERAHWVEVARFLRDDPSCQMNHFIDITAADYPEREPEEPRFDVLLTVRSMVHGHRIRVKTRVGEDETVGTLSAVWAGTNWGEREIWDMFGIRFDGHPDLRRILMYEEFEGHPLRKDYPIERTQPLVAYRDVEGIDKLPPFGPDMGQPWGRIDWRARLEGEEMPVSPSIAVQTGRRRALSEGSEGGPEPKPAGTEATTEE